MKVKDVLNCSFPEWYERFCDITLKSRIFKIPDDVLKYFLDDGTLTLPNGLNKDVIYTDSDDDDDNKIVWNDDEVDNAGTSMSQEFASFVKNLEKDIKAMGGKVIPKLNWSSPKDATWINTDKTMKCIDVSDILLLLKSSNFVMHDLTQPFDSCEDFDKNNPPIIDYNLILRRWHKLHPGGEFRCFVFQKQIKAICQRNLDFYPHILNEKKDIAQNIEDFYNRFIKDKFPSDDYVFDVYRQSKNKIFLIDFNPYGSSTDGLLFSSDELENLKNQSSLSQALDVRFIEDEAGIQPCSYSMYSMPEDILDLTRGNDINKFVDLLKLASQEQTQNSSGEENS